MATRAEQHRAAEERRLAERAAAHPKNHDHRSKPGSRPGDRSRSRKHAARKATHALELVEEGRPSRASTRKGANHIKPDVSLNLREERKRSSPEARARKAAAGSIRVRGKQRGTNGAK